MIETNFNLQNDQNFDFDRYKNLVEKKSTNKTLSKLEARELVWYKAFIQEHVFYEHRLEYKNLLTQFIEKKINGQQFVIQFHEIEKKHYKIADGLFNDFQFLKTFQVNVNANNFCIIIDMLSEICFGIRSEGEVLYGWVQESFLKLKEIC